jgi:hypothetical protein
MAMTTTFRLSVSITLVLAIASCGFATTGHSIEGAPGLLIGIWHGLLAPWTLLLRLFMDIKMYAFPNSGWPYDFGFIIGVVFSLPLGWIAVIIAVIVHLL